MKPTKKEMGPLVNEKIRFDKMQLIADDGENRGIVSRKDALNAARNANLDLVIIAESGGAGFPVAKILDYGKLLYEKKKQKSLAKKKQQVIQVKEVKLRPKIAVHDYETKLNRAIRFLNEGKHLKITLMFRGREIGMKKELGTALFSRIEKTLESADLNGKVLVKKTDAKKDFKPAGNQWSREYNVK